MVAYALSFVILVSSMLAPLGVTPRRTELTPECTCDVDGYTSASSPCGGCDLVVTFVDHPVAGRCTPGEYDCGVVYDCFAYGHITLSCKVPCAIVAGGVNHGQQYTADWSLDKCGGEFVLWFTVADPLATHCVGTASRWCNWCDQSQPQ